MTASNALILHSLIIFVLSLTFMFLLMRQNLFHWLSAGFWVWGAVIYYFIIAPLFIWFVGDRRLMELNLYATEGVDRILWITLIITMGYLSFSIMYLKSIPYPFKLNLPPSGWPPGTPYVLTLFLLGAAYTILMYRSFHLTTATVIVEGSKFTGDVTGYNIVMHHFAHFPIALLLFYKRTRFVGLLLAIVYLLCRLQDAHNRMSIISLLLTCSFLLTTLENRVWPKKVWIILILLFVFVLQIRGHKSIIQFYYTGGLYKQESQEAIYVNQDSMMLASFWLSSYIWDRSGYSYGLPLLRISTAWLPRKYFPWKDDIFPTGPTPETSKIEMLMTSGAKGTILRGFYSYGGLLGVILGMGILGFLTRRLDGFLMPSSNIAVRVLGFVWLGTYWMIFGSDPDWGIATLYISGLPLLGLVIGARLSTDDPPTRLVKLFSKEASQKKKHFIKCQ